MLLSGFGENLFIGHPVKQFLTKVPYVFAHLAADLSRGHGDSHIGKKHHAAGVEKGCASSFAKADA